LPARMKFLCSSGEAVLGISVLETTSHFVLINSLFIWSSVHHCHFINHSPTSSPSFNFVYPNSFWSSFKESRHPMSLMLLCMMNPTSLFIVLFVLGGFHVELLFPFVTWDNSFFCEIAHTQNSLVTCDISSSCLLI